MKFKTSDLKDKRVFLIGPAQNAQVEPHEYEDYDYVARLNMQLSCYDDPPRTDIVFLNARATKIFTKNVDKNLNNKIIFIKRSHWVNNLNKKYPTSSIHVFRVIRTKGSLLYSGTLAISCLLGLGMNVIYGGADFYYDGFGQTENYPEGYDFVAAKKIGDEENLHKISEDLRYIKDKLMVKFQGKLNFHEKTEHYFKKSLERYNIQ